jgi:hypothetical protein
MMMKTLRDNFASGKIDLKYYLVRPKYSKNEIIIAILILSIVVLPVLILSIRLLNSNQLNSTLIIVGIFFLLIVPYYILGRLMLKFDVIGKVQFNELYLTIQFHNQELHEIPYTEILKIEYCGGIREDLISKVIRFKSYKIRLITSENRKIDFEATQNMYLTKGELNIQRSIEPTLIRAVEAINPKYGIVMKKLK